MAGAKRAERPLATGSRAKRARRRSAHVMKPEYLVEIKPSGELFPVDFHSL